MVARYMMAPTTVVTALKTMPGTPKALHWHLQPREQMFSLHRF